MPAPDFAAELSRSHPHYVVEDLIGFGNFGAVYGARDTQTSRPVAIKALRWDALDDETYLRRFDREIALLRKLDPHPNVLRILDAGETADGYRFFVMERLEGRSLASMLQAPVRLSVDRMVRIMSDVCEGVQHVHDQKVLHRDLKADNVFMVDADDRAVVVDFGVARDLTTESSTLSDVQGAPGTPGYIAPELKWGASATVESDVFSLGTLFQHMVGGRVPDGGHEPPSKFGLERFDEPTLKAISREPNDRHASAAEFARELRAAARHSPAPPRPRHRDAAVLTPDASVPEGSNEPNMSQTATSGETAILKSRRPLAIYLFPAAILGAGLWISTTEIPAIGWLVAVFGAALLLRTIVAGLTNTITVTSTRVIARSGLVNVTSNDLPLRSVESVNVKRSPLGLILNYGTLVIHGTGGTKTEVYLVGSPTNFRDEMLQRLSRNDGSADASSRSTHSRPQSQQPPQAQQEGARPPEIEFRPTAAPFRPAKRPANDEWIDNSFSWSSKAIGHLRLPVPNNGRYESEHQVLNAQGETVGLMVNGQSLIGYTFTCVYAEGCFWLAHQTFGETMGGDLGSGVSLVAEKGRFFSSKKGAKFDVVKRFGFGGGWARDVLAFKLLDDGAYLLYLSNRGACLFSTRQREIVAKVEFAELAHQWSGFALSPKAKLLAIGGSARGPMDPLDEKYRYRNFVRLYDLKTGRMSGEQTLPGDYNAEWTVDFSEDGRQLEVASKPGTIAAVGVAATRHTFELVATR